MYGQLPVHIINENEKSTKRALPAYFSKGLSAQRIATEQGRSVPDPNLLNQDSNPDPGFMLESESGSKHHFFCPKIVVDALFGDKKMYSPP